VIVTAPDVTTETLLTALRESMFSKPSEDRKIMVRKLASIAKSNDEIKDMFNDLSDTVMEDTPSCHGPGKMCMCQTGILLTYAICVGMHLVESVHERRELERLVR
jgi:hypothetical protein